MPPFQIVQVPHDETGVRAYLDRYRAFRLHALKTEPSAFATTYEQEVELREEEWYARLANPAAITFLAMQEDRIVSTLTTIGHLKYGPEEIPAHGISWEASIEPVKENSGPEPLHYRIYGMYTLPELRGQGLAKALLKAAIKHGQDDATALGRPYVGSLVTGEVNHGAGSLYRKCGFVPINTMPYGDRMAVVLKYAPEYPSAFHQSMSD